VIADERGEFALDLRSSHVVRVFYGDTEVTRDLAGIA